MISHRPCGECRALVPANRGCKHWKPVQARRERMSARERDAKNRRESAVRVQGFARMTNRTYR